ncbi:hypothetical protein POM88_030865 [Heracleum sosnowskyi]|uniref:Uncharacterized protein n=1 Tax=Heracleum sosnowskyi TaxID=360622 RepID=A0AAD8MJ01_9APIA|nr:hypothetical protein POM88_030865 [Heracleum sosnowskyi]
MMKMTSFSKFMHHKKRYGRHTYYSRKLGWNFRKWRRGFFHCLIHNGQGNEGSENEAPLCQFVCLERKILVCKAGEYNQGSSYLQIRYQLCFNLNLLEGEKRE